MTRMFRLLVPVALALLLAPVFPWSAQAFDTRAKAAYVMDVTTGTVLLARNADEPLPARVDVQADDACTSPSRRSAMAVCHWTSACRCRATP